MPAAPSRLPQPHPVAIGGAVGAGRVREAGQAVLVRQSAPPCSGGRVHGLIALADGGPSSERAELASSLALDALEAGLQDPSMPTVEDALARGVASADHALRTRSLCAWDPHALRAHLSFAAHQDGSWHVLEVGGTHAFLLRGRAFGPVFPVPDDVRPVGSGEVAPRSAVFAAAPGDVLLLASDALVAACPLRPIAEALRVAPHLAEGCRAVVERAVGNEGPSAAIAAARLPSPPPRSGYLPAALGAAGAMLLLAVVLGYLAWRSGPTHPIIPAAARLAPQPPPPGFGEAAPRPKPAPRAEESTDSGESDGGESRPIAAKGKGQFKVVGPPGVYVEMTLADAPARKWTGTVREGQAALMFFQLPDPAEYRVSIWSDAEKKRKLRSDERVRLEGATVKIDVTDAAKALRSRPAATSKAPATTGKAPATASKAPTGTRQPERNGSR